MIGLTEYDLHCFPPDLVRGSGGNAHAKKHAEATGHPLVVKMGTITAEGNADIHCFPEDHQLLTPDGFRFVNEIVEQRLVVATYNPTTKLLEYQQPTQYHVKDVSDEKH